MTMDADKLRAWWFHRQGLDGRLQGRGAAEILAETGWARSVGGAAPYLTLFARGGVSRETADAAAAALQIHELPAVRACTYVVPAPDFALALNAAAAVPDPDLKTALKLGVTEKEIAKLRDAVLKALSKGPLDPDEIRQATGKASRSLGEEGKKKGMTTTLPLVLGRLQTAGDIRRVPVNGRLDQQRYRYCLWQPNPRRGCEINAEQVAVELARRFFKWIGPATLAEFQWFSGLGVKAAKAAVEPLKLETLDDAGLMLPAGREAFERFSIPAEPRYALVASLDGITLLKRNAKGLIDAGDAAAPLFGDGAYAGSGLTDLPSHGIFDRGRLIGLWEYDTVTESIAWTSFVPAGRELQQAIAETEQFIKNALGDARSFSLDTPKSRASRIEALRRR
jgi:hypothetical protein